MSKAHSIVVPTSWYQLSCGETHIMLKQLLKRIMIRLMTPILQAAHYNDLGCAYILSENGMALSHVNAIGTQVGEPPNGNKLIVDGEISTGRQFKSLETPKDGILTGVFAAEKHVARGASIRENRVGNIQKSPAMDATPGYGSMSDLRIRISKGLGGAS